MLITLGHQSHPAPPLLPWLVLFLMTSLNMRSLHQVSSVSGSPWSYTVYTWTASGPLGDVSLLLGCHNNGALISCYPYKTTSQLTLQIHTSISAAQLSSAEKARSSRIIEVFTVNTYHQMFSQTFLTLSPSNG